MGVSSDIKHGRVRVVRYKPFRLADTRPSIEAVKTLRLLIRVECGVILHVVLSLSVQGGL